MPPPTTKSNVYENEDNDPYYESIRDDDGRASKASFNIESQICMSSTASIRKSQKGLLSAFVVKWARQRIWKLSAALAVVLAVVAVAIATRIVFADHRTENGEFGEWSAWSGCSVTCGRGFKSRVRSCLHGTECEGSIAVEKALCGQDQEPCGEWTGWSSWSPCSVTCGGGGVRARERGCERGICGKENSQREECEGEPCTTTGSASPIFQVRSVVTASTTDATGGGISVSICDGGGEAECCSTPTLPVSGPGATDTFISLGPCTDFPLRDVAGVKVQLSNSGGKDRWTGSHVYVTFGGGVSTYLYCQNVEQGTARPIVVAVNGKVTLTCSHYY